MSSSDSEHTSTPKGVSSHEVGVGPTPPPNALEVPPVQSSTSPTSEGLSADAQPFIPASSADVLRDNSGVSVTSTATAAATATASVGVGTQMDGDALTASSQQSLQSVGLGGRGISPLLASSTTPVEALPQNSTNAFIERHQAIELHINYAWRYIDEVTYPRMRPGRVLPVYQPHCQEPAEDFPSEYVLITKGTRQLPMTHAPLSHCAHYLFHRKCKRGSECGFVHACRLDPDAKELRPWPVNTAAEQPAHLRPPPPPSDPNSHRVNGRPAGASATHPAQPQPSAHTQTVHHPPPPHAAHPGYPPSQHYYYPPQAQPQPQPQPHPQPYPPVAAPVPHPAPAPTAYDPYGHAYPPQPQPHYAPPATYAHPPPSGYYHYPPQGHPAPPPQSAQPYPPPAHPAYAHPAQAAPQPQAYAPQAYAHPAPAPGAPPTAAHTSAAAYPSHSLHAYATEPQSIERGARHPSAQQVQQQVQQQQSAEMSAAATAHAVTSIFTSADAAQ